MATESDDSISPSLFAGTASYYARYRPGYPKIFFDMVIERFHLDGRGRLLDLGCGTGQLTIPLSWHVAEAVGVDPEPEMLAEAASQAQAVRATNLTWALGTLTTLSSRLGHFRLVTMGRSFHWMDREQVLATLAEMVDDGGGIVIVNDSCLVRPATAWQQAVEEVQQRFLGPTSKIRRDNVADAHERHDTILVAPRSVTSSASSTTSTGYGQPNRSSVTSTRRQCRSDASSGTSGRRSNERLPTRCAASFTVTGSSSRSLWKY